MSLSKLNFKGRVIWTEKCGLAFHLLYRLSWFLAQQTHRVRPLAMLAYRKNRAKETSFLRQKIDQKRSWMETLTSRKVFCDVFLWKQEPWKKDFEFVFFSGMAAVSFWVSFTGVILLHEKFLQFDWLRAVVFQLNLKYVHVEITNLLRVIV